MQKFKGVYTALITPFTNDEQVDEQGLRHLIRRQIKGGVDGIVILGTTGEAPTLNEREKKLISSIAKQECLQKIPLIIGTGSYSTSQTIENTILAEEAGGDAALIVTPYYNKPTQEGLYRHYKSIAEATSIPIILYNVPSRTGQNLQCDTLRRLLEIPSIIGIKEASGNLSQISDVIDLIQKTRPDFSVLSGDDALTLSLMALGGDGVISVISNIWPKEVTTMIKAIFSSDFKLAQEIHHKLSPACKMAFLETNPIPIKAIHQMANLPSGRCRMPLCELSQENALKIQNELSALFSPQA